MSIVKSTLPVSTTDPELLALAGRLHANVLREIGPCNTYFHVPFFPTDAAGSGMRFHADTCGLRGRKLRDVDGNFYRGVNGFFLSIHHYDTDEGPLWYILFVVPGQFRHRGGGSYHDIDLPSAGVFKGSDLSKCDFHDEMAFLGSLREIEK